jgi:hypothetical protein
VDQFLLQASVDHKVDSIKVDSQVNQETLVDQFLLQASVDHKLDSVDHKVDQECLHKECRQGLIKVHKLDLLMEEVSHLQQEKHLLLRHQRHRLLRHQKHRHQKHRHQRHHQLKTSSR